MSDDVRKNGDARRRLAADVIYTPPEASTLALQMVQNRARTPNAGVVTFLGSDVDGYFLPMRPGELITVIGRPSNGKSAMMQYIARNEAIRIVRDGEDEARCVVYVTWEQAIEEMMVVELASAVPNESASNLARGIIHDIRGLQAQAMQRSALPLWLIGHSIERRRRRPRLTMTDVAGALLAIEDHWGMRPSVVVLDYLQRIMPERGNDIRTQTIENVDRAKDMALAMGCPVILGCQAKREVDERKIKLPGMGDGAESANVEHSSDGILTVWMPKTTEPSGSVLPPDLGMNLVVTDNLMLMSVAKRKMGPAGRVFPLFIRPEKNMIYQAKIDEIIL
jgi:replicative DNA helicase